MKKKMMLSLAVLLLTSMLWGSEFDHWKRLEESGVQNADLYYNLGVTYWQTGESGMANLYFLKALNLDSAHKSAKANLNYVITLSADQDLYPERLFLLRLFYEIYDFMNLNRMALLTLLGFLFTALSLSWLLHYDPAKERGLPTLILSISLLLFLGSAIFLGIKAYRQSHNSKAVLIVDQAELRVEPDPEASRVAVIHEALILDAEQEEGSWVLVRCPDGKSGWLPGESIRRVLEP